MTRPDPKSWLDELERLNASRTRGPWLYFANATICVQETPVQYRAIVTCSEREADAAEKRGDDPDAIIREGAHNMDFIAAIANNADELIRLARAALARADGAGQ